MASFGFIEQRDSLALGIARARSLFAVVVVVAMLVALFMLVGRSACRMLRLVRSARRKTKGKSAGNQQEKKETLMVFP